jgi:hypothetical protein
MYIFSIRCSKQFVIFFTSFTSGGLTGKQIEKLTPSQMKELTPSTIENLPAAILIVSMDDPLP